MDRRQQKTRAAIFLAFTTLLSKKRYTAITVQQIIDEANIGRSTFYSHFATKDELLKAMCMDIFSHVVSDVLTSEETHDFTCDHQSIESKLTHLLYHIKDSRNDIIGILSCESGDLFMRYMKEYLLELFSDYSNQLHRNAPNDYILNHLVGSFSETILWWIREDMTHSPEEVTSFYLEAITP